MKTRHRSPHAETVLSFLRSIGALITRVRRAKRIVISWRWRDHHGSTTVSKDAGPSAVARTIAEIRTTLGIAGAAA